jgi:hypothetical protein
MQKKKKKEREKLFDAGKVIGLEGSAERINCMLLSRHQSAGQNHCIKMANRGFENLAQFKHLGTIVADQNFYYGYSGCKHPFA